MEIIRIIIGVAIAAGMIALCAYSYYHMLTDEPTEWEIDEDGTSM